MTEDLSITFKLNEPSPIVYETQIEGMRHLVDAERFKPIEEFIRANCIIIDDSEKLDGVYAAWARINEQLRDTQLKRLRLGSLTHEPRSKRPNLAQDPDVSGLRGLGHRPSAVYIDEPHYSTAFHCWWGNGVTASKWVEHRVFCKRVVLECLSGE